jgi:hypothetical protein
MRHKALRSLYLTTCCQKLKVSRVRFRCQVQVSAQLLAAEVHPPCMGGQYDQVRNFSDPKKNSKVLT